jgi:amino acid adenylation domain-containing protein
LKAGGTYVPLDPQFPAERLAFMMADSQFPVLLTQQHLAELLPTPVGQVVYLDRESEQEAISQQSAANPETSVGAENLAYMIYTSGSTGTPKGVQIPHRAVVNLLQTMAQRPGLNSEDVLLAVTTLSFDIAALELFLPLLVGAQLVVASRETAGDGAQLIKRLEETGATALQATPATWRMLEESGWEGSAGLKVWCGGEALLPELGNRLRTRSGEVWNLYGPTETTIWSSVYQIQEQVEATGQSVSIGRPVANTQIYLLDGELRPAPVGVAAELYIGGEGLARGYLGRAELTAEKFIPNPFGADGERLYRTGDVARYRGAGEIEYVGRIDNQVKVRGYRIEVGEIEVALSEHEAVRQAVVAARASEGGEKRLVAYVVAATEDGVSSSELQQYLKSRLPAYMVPNVFVQLEALPLTANGKVDRRALPAPTGDREELGGEYVAPRTATEEVLAGIWAVVLHTEQVGVHDNFFELGGHSLLATQVMSRVREALGVEVALRQLFEQPTVTGLAAVIDELKLSADGLVAPPMVRVSREETLPLSFAQQRLWFLDQLEPNSSLYNIPAAVRLKGQLDLYALGQSFTEIVNRHESLRTRFGVVEGVPVQVIDEAGSFMLQVTDLSDWGEAEREAEAGRVATAETQAPFDLTTGPLFRASVLRLGAEDHVLLCTMHHVISDGWSMGVFINELTTLYTAYAAGQPSPLPELTLQYADFAHWQRGWLAGDVLEGQLGYWKKQLAGAPAALELPLDHPRPAVQTFRGAPEPLSFSAELTAALKELSRREGVTLFMTMLAAWQTLLARYSGQEDVVVGTPIAGRNRAEMEPLIGFFVNTLVLRTNLSGDPRFIELLRRVREVALGAYAHQDVPFEKLVEELQPERDLSRSPLFQTMMMLQNVPQEAMQLPGLELSPMVGEGGTTKYELTLELVETSTGLIGALRYNVDLFRAETINRMLGQFERLLESVCRKPEQRLSEVELLSEEEREQIVVGWNDTAAEYAAGTCLHQLFEKQVERSPEADAVIFEAERISYRELNERANRLAHYLQTLGVGPETLVGICVERSVEMMVGLLGILKAGGTYVPLDPQFPAERLAFMMADSQFPVLLTQQHLTEALPSATGQVVYLDRESEREAVAQQGTANPETSVGAENLAYMIYTSGSTGTPKGVQIPHRAVVNLLQTMANRPGLSSSDVLLAVTTLSFDIAALELFLPLLVGARLVVASRETASDGAQLIKRLEETGATALQATPATWRMLEESGWEESAGLKVWCGGEALLPELGNRLRTRSGEVWNLYGPTETTIWSSVYQIQEEVEATGQSVSIGRPVANTQIYLLDGELRPAPVGVAAELYIGGEGLARGYLGRAELTAERFIPNPFGAEGERLYRTGDVARYRNAGEIEYVGRIDNQVKVRGYRIEVGEIEVALSEHEAVRQAVVAARASEGGEKRLVAYVVAATDEGVSSSELQQYLKSRLPAYMVPNVFVQLEALPLTANGKVDRRALPAPTGGREELGGEYVAPRTATEEVLAGIWAVVLHSEQVGVHDNFFELGGHSLLATQVMSRVREALGVEMPLRQLFEQPTVAGLAGVIDELKQAAGGMVAPPMVRVSRDEELPLSFAQQRQWILDQLDPGSSSYNIPTAIRLHGQLDVAALERTFTEIVNRHESLRTNFAVVGGRPVQVIRPAQPVTLRITDLRAFEETERDAEARREVIAEAKRSFDLARDVLLRASLIRLEDDHYVLACTMHHIASDGWSIGVLVKELTTLYTAFRANEPSPLPELPIQYADFAHWQQTWLQGEVLEKQLDYWKRQLDQVPPLLLPTDRPRPAVQTFPGSAEVVILNKDLTRQLKALSQREGGTLFMVLLAALKTVLARHARQDDISVGTFIANRNRAEIEGLVGFFVNNLTLRTDLSGDPSFRELVRRVRNVTLAAYAHQDVPFEKVLETLQPERDLSRTPLFQVMFVLQNTPGEAIELPGLTLSPVMESSGGGRANFDITLWMSEVNEELVGYFQYNTDLFDASTMMRMAGHFQTLIESAVDCSDARLSELPILTEAERKLSVDWNDTARDYVSDRCVHELFELQAEKTPDAIAVVFEDEQLTYAELNKRANRVAHHLIGLGVGPDVRVGICVERSIEMVVGLIGILKAGGAYVPLDPSYPQERLSLVMVDADPLVLLTQDRLRARLPKHRATVVCLDTNTELLGQETQANEENPVTGVTAENMSYVIFTSGSTGTPKGVMVHHRGVVNFLSWMQSTLQLDEQDRWLMKASFGFDASVLELFHPLMVGAGVVLARPDGAQDSTYLVRTIARHRVTAIHFVASMMVPFLDHKELPAATSLKHVVSGGEALPLETMERFYARSTASLVNVYGPTEASIACTGWSCELNSERLVVPIGTPASNTQAHVLDQNLQPVPIGVPGELHIGGDAVVRGYLNRPELTAEKFIPDPFSNTPGARLYKTGDLVRYLPDGNLDFLERIDGQVKVRGFRIELGEVEAALRKHAAVREAVVMAREDTPGDQRLVAYLIAESDQRPTNSDLRQFMKQTLPEYLVPSDFVLLNEFPLNHSGKLDRSALPAPSHDRPELEKGYLAARNPIEEKLTAIWQEVLRVERVGVHDNFFDLSGHSLQATQMISRAQTAFHVEISLRALFDSPTVAGFAECVEKLMQSGQTSTVALGQAGLRNREALSYAQQRLWFLDQLTPGSAAYNVASAMRLRGILDVSALTRALNEIISRHEALRTTFEVAESEPVQIIAQDSALTIPIVQLADASEMQRLIREESTQPFDLAQGPLLRAKLLQIDEQDHVLLLTLHHIICDGWSIGVLVRELAALYEAYANGQESPLEPLAIQYADYARWQREWLQGEVLEQQLAYWKEQLAGTPAVLELPTDRPRPVAQIFRGKQQSVRFSSELTQALNAFSREEGVTLFMTILGAFQTLLFRYCRQEQITVGSPIANRNRAELESLIGFFANTLALRTDLSGDPSFRELLGRVKEVAVGAYAHQDVPFERLVEELQPERSLSHSPLFQVMLVLQNAPSTQLQLPGVSLETMDVTTETVKFDLTLLLTEAEQGLEGRLEYNTDLFDATRIQRMLGHFEALLDSVLSNPEQRLSELQLLRPAEREQIVVEWNNRIAKYPREKCIHELFEEQAGCKPDAIAVTYEDERISYRELNERANQLAHYLQSLGVGPEVIVGLCVERSIEMVVGLLAILKAGGAYLPLDPTYPHERIAFMLDDAEVPVLLTQSHLRDSLPSHSARVLCIDSDGSLLSDCSLRNPATPAGADNVAYLIYTSGSSGRPKGVLVRQRAVVNLAHALHGAIYQDVAGDRSLRVGLNAPLAFDASVKQIIQLAWGHTLCLIPDHVRADGEALLAYLEAQHVDVVDATPVQVRLLLAAAGGSRLGSVEAVLVGGEAIDENLWALMSESSSTQYYNVYGPTECTVDTTVRRVEGPIARLGHGLGNVEVYLLDQQQQIVPIGVPGELCVGGAGLARGYLNQPGLTAEKFIPHPFSQEAGARLYRTGDVARYAENGELEYVGRVDHQVKVRGYRIELGEIESALLTSEHVKEAAVVVRRDGEADRLVAYVVSKEEVSVSQLVSDLSQQLPTYMVPTAFVMLAALPLTPNGKVDRRALPAPGPARPELRDIFVSPQTETEEKLAAIWQEVLRVDRIGIHDNFFELGGHSLLATQVISRVRKSFQVEIGLRSLFESPTVFGLALAVTQSLDEQTSRLANVTDRIEKVDENHLLTQIEELSDEDVSLLLSSMLSEAEVLDD